MTDIYRKSPAGLVRQLSTQFRQLTVTVTLGIYPHLVSGRHPPLTDRPVQVLIAIARRLDIHPADLVPAGSSSGGDQRDGLAHRNRNGVPRHGGVGHSGGYLDDPARASACPED